MKKPKIYFGVKSVVLIAVAAALVAVDLITKYFAKSQVWKLVVIPGFVEIDASVPMNSGCAFSFLNDNPEFGQPFLITLTFIMLAVLIAVFLLLPEKFTLLKTAVSLVFAGAVGNLVDRLMFRSVRDFFGLNMLGMTYCNFADFFIVIGTVIAVVDLLFLNEFALVPLTKKAKAAQAKRAEKAEADNGKKDGE